MGRNNDGGDGLPRSVRIVVALLGALGGLTGIAALITALVAVGIIRPPTGGDSGQGQEPPPVRLSPTPAWSLSSITANNVSTYLGRDKGGRNYWQWTVYLQGPGAALDQIEYVEYNLDHDFTPPVTNVFERGTNSRAFPLTATGYGMFEMKITLFLRDGREHTFTYFLRL